MIFSPIFVVIVGLLTGGLINVLADDLPARRAPRTPRYPDDTPRPLIAWLGITAFLFGKQVSPNGARLTRRYPLTELLTVALMVMVVFTTADDPAMTPLQLVFWLFYMALFVLITIIDLEHRLILFVTVIPASIIALIDAATTTYGADLGEALLGGLLGFGIFFLMYLGGFLFVYVMHKTRGYNINEVAFGYGDVMLITLSGFILGWQPLVIAIFLTVFIGAIGSIAYLIGRQLRRRGYSLFTPLPYGPYIIIGTLLMLVFSPEITALLLTPAT